MSPVDVARAQLDAIDRLNHEVNAFVLIDGSVALEMAQASEGRYLQGEALGPLDGVPITVKDTLNVALTPCLRSPRTSAAACITISSSSSNRSAARLRAGLPRRWRIRHVVRQGPGCRSFRRCDQGLNVSGTHPNGGVLLAFGDDYAGKSSSLAHQSDLALAAHEVDAL